MIALNLLDSLQLDKFKIVGVSPKPNTFADLKIETVTPEYILYDKSSNLDNLDFILNFTRGNNAYNEKLGVNRILEKFTASTKHIINSSTYAQHYQINKIHNLSSYLTSKQSTSQFLSSPTVKSKVFDISFFTLLGKHDKISSLISRIIPKLLKNEEISLTRGEQLISYTDVSDIVFLVKQLIGRPHAFIPGKYSFWPTPPVKLRVVIEALVSLTESKSKINYGSTPYSGHELFSYDENGFPPQIISDYNWKTLKKSLLGLISDHKILTEE